MGDTRLMNSTPKRLECNPRTKCKMTNCKEKGNYRNMNGNKYCKKHIEVILAQQRRLTQ